MNTPYNSHAPAGNGLSEPANEILAARKTCRELLALLIEENQAVPKHDIQLVEDRLVHKRRLTLRLEQMLSDIKQKGSLWKADASARQQANQLAEEIAEFQTLARENAMMLKAAHQLRADLIMAIRDTVDAHQPRVQTYGASGTLNTSGGETRLVATSI
jgi:hypothetical protein